MLNIKSPVDEAFKRKKDKVIILGFSPYTLEMVPWQNSDFEFWGMNDLYLNIPRADRWFEIHIRELIEATPRSPEHLKWLRNAKIPIYMNQKNPDIPFCVEFPINECIRRFQYGDYLTNSASYMIALAIMMDYKEIRVYGIDMASDSLLDNEYAFQRPSCEFWLGIAAAKKIKLFLPPKCDLLKKSHLYGYQEDDDKRIKIEARLRDFQGRIAQIEQQKRDATNGLIDAVLQQGPDPLKQIARQTRAQIHQNEMAASKYAGAVENSDYVIRVWSLQNELKSYLSSGQPKF